MNRDPNRQQQDPNSAVDVLAFWKSAFWWGVTVAVAHAYPVLLLMRVPGTVGRRLHGWFPLLSCCWFGLFVGCVPFDPTRPPDVVPPMAVIQWMFWATIALFAVHRIATAWATARGVMVHSGSIGVSWFGKLGLPDGWAVAAEVATCVLAGSLLQGVSAYISNFLLLAGVLLPLPSLMVADKERQVKQDLVDARLQQERARELYEPFR